MKKTAVAFAVALTPGVALAHPDHGLTSGDVGLLHFVTDPFHLALTGGVALIILALRHGLRSRRAAGSDRA